MTTLRYGVCSWPISVRDNAARMGLSIDLLGPPVVAVDNAPLAVDTRKAVAILAFLACRTAPASRDALAFLLWPDFSTERSRAALRRTLSALRGGLGERWLRSDRLSVELVREEDVSIDVDRFELLSPSQEVASMAEAADLYRGDFMSGFTLRDSSEFDDWQLAQAAHFRRRAGDLLERLSQARLDEGDYRSALSAARRWLSLDQLHEPAHRQLMRIYAVSGDRAAAMRQYRSAVATLEDQLGVGPLTETTRLYREITAGRLEPAGEQAIEPRREERQALKRPRSIFVGRREALAEMVTAYGSAGLRFVAVTGEPGIGKTRLADEFAASLQTDLPVLRASGHRHEVSVPFGIAIDALRSGLASPASATLDEAPPAALAEAARLVPELRERRPALPEPPPVDGPGGHARLLRGTAETLVAMAGSGVVLLDDLQWADQESVSVIASMARSSGEALIVLLYRSEEVRSTDPLAGLIREASRLGELSSINLPRLRIDDLVEWIRTELPDHIDRADDLYRLSEGVPYFVMEYLATLRDDPEGLGVMPPGVRDLLVDRIARLDDKADQVMTAAAVLGRSFDLQTVKAVSGRSEPETSGALEDLLTEGIILETATPNTFDFHHERLRQLVLDRASSIRKSRLHSRAADRMLAAASRGKGHIAAAAAIHLEGAGRLDEAARQQLVAARYARELFANEAALQHYESALALGHPDTAVIREAIGDLLGLAGGYGEALVNLEAAAAENPGRAGHLEHKIGLIHARAGDWDAAEAHMASAGDLYASRAEVARLLADRAWVAHRMGEDDLASSLAQRALAGGDSGALAQAHNVAGMIARKVQPIEARKHLETSLSLVAELDPAVRAAALNNLGLVCLSAGDAESGLEYEQEALEVCRRLGDRHKEAAVHSNIADLLHASGRDAEAVEHLAAAASLFAEIGLEPGTLEPEIWKLTEW